MTWYCALILFSQRCPALAQYLVIASRGVRSCGMWGASTAEVHLQIMGCLPKKQVSAFTYNQPCRPSQRLGPNKKTWRVSAHFVTRPFSLTPVPCASLELHGDYTVLLTHTPASSQTSGRRSSPDRQRALCTRLRPRSPVHRLPRRRRTRCPVTSRAFCLGQRTLCPVPGSAQAPGQQVAKGGLEDRQRGCRWTAPESGQS